MTFNLDINVVRGFMTVAWMLMFLGIVWWAFHPRSRTNFEQAANLPFADEGAQSADASTAATSNMQQQDQTREPF